MTFSPRRSIPIAPPGKNNSTNNEKANSAISFFILSNSSTECTISEIAVGDVMLERTQLDKRHPTASNRNENHPKG